jgi:hypothetical protein
MFFLLGYIARNHTEEAYYLLHSGFLLALVLDAGGYMFLQNVS